MQQLVFEWYGLLSSLNAAAAIPLRGLADGIGLAPVSALLFGLIGTTAPCQLTTNVSALAFVARSATDRGSVARGALAYVLGKMLVYTILGLAVIVTGRELAQSAIPVVVTARKILGPVMIFLGLHLLGVIPLRFSVGSGFSSWLEDRAGKGSAGAFVLGTAFAFAFCPTLFLLFFGLTIPLALSAPAGVVYPGVFALGTTLPLLAFAALAAAGASSAQGFLGGARAMDAWIRPAAGIVLVLAGLNDTVVYWFL
ncbi:MAG: sulfite exporter TauE/SafE family protein [Chloroflexi bacterium]|nr:sulfite exporter TauE/SafE family protein [Chloroflexota bacterium]